MMASFALKPLFCFIVLFCFVVHNVEAREGKLLFSKVTHLDRPNNKEVALSPAPAPGLAQANGRLGDGPFGPGSGMIPQTKESWPVSSTTTDEDFEKLMATFDEEKNNKLPEAFEEEEEEESEDPEDPEDLNEQKDKYNNNNNNGYTYTTNNYNDNRRGYGNEEKQGMSDTRFMENGKYFYDRKGRNNPSRGYESARGNDHPNEYETMEEYYKSLEGSQEEYEP
ncbi:PREDICTED: protein E6-like [Camelina sativa]|uniref:Protein E6-like n=1 Tax=Camelina sativa TaxID=90675 RepID=A0ABM0X970_CAMSA|nr:PREDICTED: protein E6-like [Camelina sativa]